MPDIRDVRYAIRYPLIVIHVLSPDLQAAPIDALSHVSMESMVASQFETKYNSTVNAEMRFFV